jgi:hypothetical protein
LSQATLGVISEKDGLDVNILVPAIYPELPRYNDQDG